jgi:hypothetical protein
MLPHLERADRIGEFWGYPESRAFAELLIDCEEDRTLRGAVLPEGLSPFSDVPELPKPPDVRAGCLRNDSDCDPGTGGPASPPGMARRSGSPSDPSPSGVDKPGVPGRPCKAPGATSGTPRVPRTASVAGRTASGLRRTNRPGWIGRRGD